VGLCGLALCGRARAQTPAPTDVPPPPSMSPGEPQGRANPGNAHGAPEPDAISHGIEERMAVRRNSERQKMLVADTDRLLALAQQLKADVDKTDKDVLSIDVVKRAEQIEKLAKSVKEKMRGN
jgi:hypothetical protein